MSDYPYDWGLHRYIFRKECYPVTDLSARVKEAFCDACRSPDKPYPKCWSTCLGMKSPEQVLAAARRLVVATSDWLDLSPCHKCGKEVVCIPEGLPVWCDECYREENE